MSPRLHVDQATLDRCHEVKVNFEANMIPDYPVAEWELLEDKAEDTSRGMSVTWAPSDRRCDDECKDVLRWWMKHKNHFPFLRITAFAVNGFLAGSGGLECDIGSFKDIMRIIKTLSRGLYYQDSDARTLLDFPELTAIVIESKRSAQVRCHDSMIKRLLPGLYDQETVAMSALSRL
jgi:hypothetical protein